MMHPVWSESEPERDQLMPYRIPLFVVGVFHTLLCAGTARGPRPVNRASRASVAARAAAEAAWSRARRPRRVVSRTRATDVAVTEEYLVFFEKALDAGKDVRGGFKFMNRILMLHMMLQGLAKRSGRDPQDIFSRTFYRFCIRIEEELGDEAFRID